MKNSKEYSKEVQKFFRALKRKYPKVKKVSYDEPLDSLVCAIISENMDETETQSALKRFADYFVDLNDLRVSRIEEIIDVLGADTPVTRQTAVTLTKVLRAVFNKYNTISLEALKKMSKRPARGILEKFEDISPFAVNYCTLTSLRGHAVPLTKKMIEYLRNNQLVDPEADEQEIEGFLTRQISSKSAYEFYNLLRLESKSHKLTKKKTTRKTKKTKKKTKKKTSKTKKRKKTKRKG